MKLPKDFPKFQTVEWWIEELKEYPPKAIVLLLTGPQGAPSCMLSTYHPHIKETYKEDLKYLYIDVGN